MEFRHQLGIKGRDVINGFTGIVIARSENITGCNRYLLEGDIAANGGHDKNSIWVDEQALEVLDPNPVKLPGATVLPG